MTWRHWPPIMRGLLLTYFVLASNYAGSFVDLEALASRGGVWGRSPQEEMTAATAEAAATVSQELSPFDLALGASRPGTKYPVRGIPHFNHAKGKSIKICKFERVSVCIASVLVFWIVGLHGTSWLGCLLSTWLLEHHAKLS